MEFVPVDQPASSPRQVADVTRLSYKEDGKVLYKAGFEVKLDRGSWSGSVST